MYLKTFWIPLSINILCVLGQTTFHNLMVHEEFLTRDICLHHSFSNAAFEHTVIPFAGERLLSVKVATAFAFMSKIISVTLWLRSNTFYSLHAFCNISKCLYALMDINGHQCINGKQLAWLSLCSSFQRRMKTSKNCIYKVRIISKCTQALSTKWKAQSI